MTFPRTLAGNKTQMALFRIWTRVANLISYDDNSYAKHVSYVSAAKMAHCSEMFCHRASV